ncbi:MAG: ComF family protein [Ignavibacteria bacterium]|nr:ComF family protein [Ignavibacteria bacterium]
MKIVNDIVDFLYPRICLVSESNLPEDNTNRYILDSTLANLERVSKNQLNELRGKVKSDFAFSLYDFAQKSDFEKIIHHLKYSGMKDLGVFLGEHLAGYVKLEIAEQKEGYDYIIPVPLHKTKVRERGYNQSEYIVKGLSESLNIPFLFDAISRKLYTKSQTKLTLLERQKNILGAFAFNKSYNEELKDKNIILLDDVITTGATVNECIKVLRETGVNKIFTVSLAMAE